MISLESMIKAFELLIVSNTNQQIKQCQQNLTYLSSSDDFISILSQLLQSQALRFQIRKAAAVYTLKHTRIILGYKNQSKTNVLCEGYLNILKPYTIPIKLKNYIAKSLQMILTADRAKIIRNAFYPNLIGLFNSLEKMPENQINYEFLGFYGQIVMANPGFSEDVTTFITKTFSILIKLMSNIQYKIEKDVQDKNQASLNKNIELLRIYANLLKLYLRRFIFSQSSTNKLLYIQTIEPMITKILQFNFPGNKLDSSLFIIHSNSCAQDLNKIKAYIIFSLTSIVKVLNNGVKDDGILGLNHVYCKVKEYIPGFIKQVSTFLKVVKIDELSNAAVLKTVEQVLRLFNTLVRMNFFYKTITDYKTTFLQNVIFKLVKLNNNDINNYTDIPEQFFHTIIHLIQRQNLFKQKQIKNKSEIVHEDDPQEIQDQTIRTLGAEVLVQMTKYHDGTLKEIFQFSLKVLDNEIDIIDKALALLLIMILFDQAKQRQDLVKKLHNTVYKLFQQYKLPTPQQNKLRNIEFSLNILVLAKYMICFEDLDQRIFQSTFKLVHAMLIRQNIDEVAKLIAYQVIDKINKIGISRSEQTYAVQILIDLNGILKQKQPASNLLQCINSTIKCNVFYIENYPHVVVETVEILTKMVKNILDNNRYDKVLINKAWNIIREVGQSQEFIPKILKEIQQCVLVLLPYLDMPQVDYDEDILILMHSFIEKSKKVTNNQLLMLEYVPKIFFNKNYCQFNNAFFTLQTFIYYGKDILSVSPLAIKSIIEMCRTSILTNIYGDKKLTEADNCEGVLILQSLILSVGSVFDDTVWKQLANIITQRIKRKNVHHELISNLYGTLGLIVFGGYQNFTLQENKILLELSIEKINVFTVEYSTKIFVVAMSELLTLTNEQFIQQQYFAIFDIIITLLQIISTRIQTKKLDDDQQEEQQRDYKNSLQMVKNSIKNIDQFQYFKNKIFIIRDKAPNILHNMFEQLPIAKKQFFKKILQVERIMNTPRQILKIKRQ